MINQILFFKMTNDILILKRNFFNAKFKDKKHKNRERGGWDSEKNFKYKIF